MFGNVRQVFESGMAAGGKGRSSTRRGVSCLQAFGTAEEKFVPVPVGEDEVILLIELS